MDEMRKQGRLEPIPDGLPLAETVEALAPFGFTPNPVA